MTRFLFMNTTLSWNKGSAAQVCSTRDALLERDSSAQFSLISHCPTLDQRFEKHCRVRVIGYPDDEGENSSRALKTYFLRLLAALLLALLARFTLGIRLMNGVLAREIFCREILQSDLVIDLSGDSLSDRGSNSAVNLIGILLCVTIGKPVVCYSQSMGPFKKWTKPFAKLILARARAVTVRERISYDCLVGLGLNPARIHQFGDCAFLLAAVDRKRVENLLSLAGCAPGEHRPLIGISVSALMAELQMVTSDDCALMNTPYMKSIHAIASKMRERRPNTHFILVSHVIAPRHWCRDDRWLCHELAKSLGPSQHVHVLSFDYTPEELKGLIGACDFFVGSRMHACIAALSQGIPTVALSWSYKYIGIMDRLGMKDYVYDAMTMAPKDIARLTEEAFLRKDAISEQLAKSAKAERESAVEGINAILNVLV